MGRQKTLWIDEICWKKLENMEGDSVSEKVRVCIKSHGIDSKVIEDALRRQIMALKLELKNAKIDGWWNDWK